MDIMVNDHDTIWANNGKPAVTIYRYSGSGNASVIPDGSTNTLSNTSNSNKNKVYQVDELVFVNGI
ncbi:hypothetical protein IW492_08915 [Enterococcus sp. BWB1-3]|uniref:hypothetical protein n=1 Tax=Enterococcus sp. BWB1-3 TaxID=2787713 RepID=UPI001920F8A1|nr:hypothetical protein [Enterococcus sp. BWB1-3]MBL1229349.1 hypothetical protein [Enterococcus sp. BWB1-3]